MAGYARVKEARSCATTPERLRVLAADEVYPVRVYAAGNPHTPPDALDAIAREGDRYLRWVVVLNRSAPESALRLMIAVEAGSDSKLVHHPNAPEELRARVIDGKPGCPPGCDHYLHRQEGWG